jgi:hypothetical protein
MNIHDDLKDLAKLQRVEAPPFLMTRIRAKIEANRSERLTPRWALAASLAFGLLLVANISLLNSNGQSPVNHNMEIIASGFDLVPNNQLYHE